MNRPVLLALALVLGTWLTVFPYSASLNNPNERTRVLQARSLVEFHTLSIGASEQQGRALRYRDGYGRVWPSPFVNDMSVTCTNPSDKAPCAGALFPAKAPGTALLGAPLLGVARGFGLVPDGANNEAKATWLLRLSIMGFVLFGLMAMAGLLARAGVRPAIVAATVLAAGLGSSVMPYSVSFVGHAAAGAALLLGVYFLVVAAEGPTSKSRHPVAALGGLLTASAVLFEYHAVPAVFAVGLWTVASPARARRLPGFVVGALAAFAIFAWAHLSMYGTPFETGHGSLVSQHNRDSQSHGFLGLDGLHPSSLAAHLGDPYMGLGPTMPWLLIAGLTGLFLLLRGKVGSLPPGAARALAASVLLYLLFVTCLGNFRVMNGWSFGPRYLVPAMLPLAMAAGVMWEKATQRSGWLGAAVGALALHGIVVMVTLTLAYPSPPDDIRNPFAELALPLVMGGYGVRTVGLGLGWAWWLPTATLALTALGIVLWASTAGAAKGKRGVTAVASAALAGALITALVLYRPTPADGVKRAQDFMQKTVEGASPAGNGTFFGPKGAP